MAGSSRDSMTLSNLNPSGTRKFKELSIDSDGWFDGINSDISQNSIQTRSSWVYLKACLCIANYPMILNLYATRL